jgi:hypothetical protein
MMCPRKQQGALKEVQGQTQLDLRVNTHGIKVGAQRAKYRRGSWRVGR